METKLCKKCGMVKPVSEFHIRGEKYQSWCKNCKKEWDHNEYKRKPQVHVDRNRNRRQKHRDWLYTYKKSLHCAYCGLKDKPWLLSFHHLYKDDKSCNISDMVGDSKLESVMEEIKKCVCLCHNCHSDLHHYENTIRVNINQ